MGCGCTLERAKGKKVTGGGKKKIGAKKRPTPKKK